MSTAVAVLAGALALIGSVGGGLLGQTLQVRHDRLERRRGFILALQADSFRDVSDVIRSARGFMRLCGGVRCYGGR
jgi:hypothetical protein